MCRRYIIWKRDYAMRTVNDIHHIVVAEGSPIVREGLLQVLCRQTSVHIHAVAVATVHSLYDMLRMRSFHMVFVSPDFGGDFDLERFRLEFPDVPCVALVSDLGQLARAREYGAFITVTSDEEEVLHLVETVRDMRRRPAEEEEVFLSVREKEILVGIARGLSNKEIADRLCIAVYTVTTHRRNICRKLNIHSTAGLTVYALAHGLVEI